MDLFLIAWRNLKRRPWRTVLLTGFVSASSCVLFLSSVVLLGTRDAISTGMERLGADIIVVPMHAEPRTYEAFIKGRPYDAFLPRAAVDQIKAIEDVSQASPMVLLKPSLFPCCYQEDLVIAAFDPATDFTILPWLSARLGRGLNRDEIIVGSRIPVLPGDEIPFFGSWFKVAGKLDPAGIAFFDQGIFMLMDAAFEMAEASASQADTTLSLNRTSVSAVMVKVRSGHVRNHTAIRIDHLIAGSRSIVSDTVVDTVKDTFKAAITVMLAVSILFWIIIYLSLGLVFLMIVNERRQEFGLLRSIGARTRHIVSLILLEGVMVSAAGGISGVVIGSALTGIVGNIVYGTAGIPYLAPSVTVKILYGTAIAALASAMGCLASLLPVLHAERHDPLQALHNAE